jgi:hypothetical protein
MNIKSPFDVINILGSTKYNEIANVDKKRHFFIINRMLSRTLPEIACDISHNSVVPETILDFWNLIFVEYNKTSRGRKILQVIRGNFRVSMAGAKKKSASKKIDKDLAKKYMELAKISPKEFKILEKFYEKDLIKYLKEFSKMIKTSDK